MDSSPMSYPLRLLINEETQKHIDSIAVSHQEIRAFYGHAYFVICGSCFWCVSDLSGGSRVNKCPVCSEENKIESIPLAPREKYTFDIDAKAGIILDFAAS